MKLSPVPHTLRAACRALLLAGGLTAALAACSRQGEGERCSLLNGNRDCDGGRVCTPASELRSGDDGVDRCCPVEVSSDTDRRCLPRVGGVNGTGGTGPGAGQGGQGGGGGATN